MLGGSRASALQRAAGFSSRRGSPFQSASNGSTSAPYATDPTSYATAAPTTSATALQQQQQHPFKRDLSYAAYSLRVDDVRTAIADHLRDRGVVGVFALVRALKRAEFNGEISLARFETVLAEHRLGLARADVALLFNEFDERRRNLVNVDKIVDGLRMRLEPRTLELLDRIFDAFKSTHSRVQADEVRKRFSPSTHPDVIARTRRESTVLVEFLDTFTYDLEVTRYDLVRYYELARLAADDDTHLFDIVCGVWIDYVPDALKPVGSATGTSSQHLHTRMMREDAVQTPLEPYVRVRDAFESSRPTGGTYGSSTSVRKEMSAVAEEADDDLDSYALGRYERNAGTSTTATGPGRPSYRTMRATTFTDAEIDAEAARLERLAVDERSGYSTQFSGGGGLGYADSAALASSLPPPKSYVQSPWDRDERPASGAGSMTGSGGGGRRGTRGGPPASTAYGLPGSSANTAALPAEAGSSSHRRMVAAAATNGSDQYRPSTTFSFASPVAIGVHDGQTSIPTTTMRQMDSMHTARSLFATPARPLVRLRRCLRAEATRDLRPGSGGTLLVDRAAFLRAWINAGGVGTEIAAEALWRDLAHHGAPVHAADHEHPEPAAEISVNAICRALRVRDPTPRRVQIVDQAFTRLDVLDQGLVQTNVLKRVYDKHAGTSSKSRSALADDMWGCFGDEVSRDEFQEFYADVGSTIEDDSFFVLMVWTEWNL